MLEERSFDTGSVAINFGEGSGAGPPLVMLHGISMWWRSFVPIIPYLSERFHLYALDFRGHGRSGRTPNQYYWERYAEDTIAFWQEVVGQPAFMVGHSLGAMVAVQVAAAAPELVRAVTLEDPPLYGYKGERLRARPNYKLFVGWRDLALQDLTLTELEVELAKLQPGLSAKALQLRAESLQLLDPNVLSMYIDGAATEGYETDQYLPKLACRVLLLRGDPSEGGAIEDADEAHAVSLLKECTVYRFSNVGHAIHPYKPRTYRQLVAEYFSSP